MLSGMGKAVTDRFSNTGQNNYLTSAAAGRSNSVSRERVSKVPTTKRQQPKAQSSQTPVSNTPRRPSLRGSMAGYKGEKSATINMNGQGYDNPEYHKARYRQPTAPSPKILKLPEQTISPAVSRNFDMRKPTLRNL